MAINVTLGEAKKEIAIKHKLGTTLVTGHKASYFEEAALLYADQFKVKNLANPMLAGSFSAEYLEWVKQAELPPLTNTQHYFAEWLLKNKEMLMQIGDLDIIFTKVRKWLKNYS